MSDKIEGILLRRGKNVEIQEKTAGIKKERMAIDPNFERTREHQAEFKRAGKAAKLLRKAFGEIVDTASDSKVIARLVKNFILAIRADAINNRGLRNVQDGQPELLRNFKFNDKKAVDTVLSASFTAIINRAAGTLTIEIPRLVPLEMVKGPVHATHCRIRLVGTAIDFEKEEYTSELQSTAAISLIETAPRSITLTANVPPNSPLPLFLGVAIDFSQIIGNGTEYPLKGMAYNAMDIVKVSKI